MEMVYRERWEAEIAEMRRVLADFEMQEECKWGKPTYTVDGKNIVIMQGSRGADGAVPKGPTFQARLRGADARAAEELPLPLCRGQTVGDSGGANRKGDAGDIRRPRVPGETLTSGAARFARFNSCLIAKLTSRCGQRALDPRAARSPLPKARPRS